MPNNNGCDCNCSSDNQNSSFIFGLILGAIIGAVIAIIIYRNDKNEVIVQLKEKLSQVFNQFVKKAQNIGQDFTSSSKKSSKVKKTINHSNLIAESVITESEPKSVPVKKKTPKTFIRPKK